MTLMYKYIFIYLHITHAPLDIDDPSLNVIYDKYLSCLRTFTRKHFPSQPNRVEELLVRLPEVSSSEEMRQNYE